MKVNKLPNSSNISEDDFLKHIISQFGAQVREEQALAERNRLRELVGDWEA